ncbi:hypothetical protein E6H35_05140 [Candidatus Bathyarchaeota archaeon]|nr:MAG: hypothetical protein E6H35_05140 [Candidatus Bathyarchaeota archaeon]
MTFFKMLSTIRASFVAIFVALAFTSPVFASSFVLHPAGFGPHSYAAWADGQGLPDSHVTVNQALYFQKMTTTATNAAGVAIFKGFGGLPSSDLTGLKFWVGTDGHCGAGAPRFDVLLQFASGMKQFFFAGCQSGSGMAATGMTAIAPNGRVFQQREVVCWYPSGAITCVTSLPPGTIVSVAIVFDEGTDQGVGFVFLDNIEIDSASTGTHLWTSAADNHDPSASTTTFDTTVIEALLGAPLTSLYITGQF